MLKANKVAKQPKKATRAKAVKKVKKVAPVSAASRSYVVKHTHLHTWKKEKKVDQTSLKERQAKRAEERIISTEQFKRASQPFDFPVITKLPVEQRKTKNPVILQQCDAEELGRLVVMPRETVPFKVGDKIAVTTLLSMTESKTQVFKGVVISQKRKKGLYGRFTLRNNSDGGFYEISFPYWSPFLRKIEMIEKDPEPLVGKNRLENYFRNLPLDHPKNKVV